MKTKTNGIWTAVAALGFAAVLCQSGLSFAQEGADQDQAQQEQGAGYQHPHRHHRHEFMMGVCVGQNLAQQGVTLPAPTPGVKPSPNPTIRAAFKAAIESCRAEFGHPSNSPTPAPTTSASPSN